ncbi:hypothetical protein P7K49_032800 [Saguinus oedipus]|uniref:Uncharacterized protein n=1 Tax=Saguinus oedipus TaxID=9490 RepID=A0ABQ9TQ21_SAGOE|nr:hypothetical protein P7K49_032800 [Saguinus oedipus]
MHAQPQPRPGKGVPVPPPLVWASRRGEKGTGRSQEQKDTHRGTPTSSSSRSLHSSPGARRVWGGLAKLRVPHPWRPERGPRPS